MANSRAFADSVWLAPAVHLFSSRWASNTLVDVVASNASLDLQRLHQNTYMSFCCMLNWQYGQPAGQLTIHYVIVKVVIVHALL